MDVVGLNVVRLNVVGLDIARLDIVGLDVVGLDVVGMKKGATAESIHQLRDRAVVLSGKVYFLCHTNG